MSQASVLLLLPQTAYDNPGDGSGYDVVGEPKPAAAFYLGNRDLQTVQYSLNGFTGTLIIQASLSSNPEENWFDVFTLEADVDSPLGSSEKEASDAVDFENIKGNFVSIRAKLVNFKSGSVEFVKVCY